jgi:DNA-binding SARP family transcriptional activator
MTAQGERPELRVEVLGPVRAWRAERELELGPPLRRGLFVTLALAGRSMQLAELATALWPDPPATAEGNLHTYLSGLRRELEPDPRLRRTAGWLTGSAAGYRLGVPADGLDGHRFERHRAEAVRRAATGDLAGAVTEQDAALALWQGPPLAGIPGPFAEAERTRFTEHLLTLAEDRARTLLDLGRPDATLAADLAALAREHPFRERLRGLLMLVQYRIGRQADALASFAELRRTLAEELGVPPDEGLVRLHERIVARDPTLGAPHTGAVIESPAAAPTRRPPAQLPHDVTGFANRISELAELTGLVGREPVLVLAGTAGVGKTALAVHLAHRVREAFPDGQLFLDLRGFDPQHPPMSVREALERLLRALGQERDPAPADEAVLRERYRRRTAGRRLLVLLDNAATAEQVAPLLVPGAAGLVVVTSRNRLAELPGRHLALDVLDPDSAGALLRGVVGARRLADSATAAAELAELARLCGHLPLALRLAAARLVGNPMLRPADVVEDLTDELARLDVLATPDDGDATLRSVLSWSYRALGPTAARLFRYLGLHPTAVFGAHVAAATAGLSPAQAREALTELVRGHLAEELPGDRYRLHDLLRVYAGELVIEVESEPDRTAALRRMLDWYVRTTDAAGHRLNPLRARVDLGPAPDQPDRPRFEDYEAALHWLESELGTLAAAVRLAHGRGELVAAWQLAAAMFDVLYVGRHWPEWTATYELGIDAARRVGDTVAEQRLTTGLGFAQIDLHRFAEAESAFRRGQEFWARQGDRRFEVNCLQGLGIVLTVTGRGDEALAASEHGLAMAQADGDQWAIGWLLNNLGAIHKSRGELAEASGYLNRALTLCEVNDHPACESYALVNLGNVNHLLGRDADARRYLVRAVGHCRRTGARLSEAHALLFLGKVADALGQREEALRYWRESWAVFADLGDRESQLSMEVRMLLGIP